MSELDTYFNLHASVQSIYNLLMMMLGEPLGPTSVLGSRFFWHFNDQSLSNQPCLSVEIKDYSGMQLL